MLTHGKLHVLNMTSFFGRVRSLPHVRTVFCLSLMLSSPSNLVRLLCSWIPVYADPFSRQRQYVLLILGMGPIPRVELLVFACPPEPTVRIRCFFRWVWLMSMLYTLSFVCCWSGWYWRGVARRR